MNTWIHQKIGYELGNFITMTPGIRGLYKISNQKINVYFDTKYLKDIFRDFECINILNKIPSFAPINNRGVPHRINNESDYEAWHRMLTNNNIEMQDPYIDSPLPKFEVPNNSCAIIHGCITNGALKTRKDLGKSKRISMIEEARKAGYNPIILGSKSDYADFWEDINYDCNNYAGKLNIRDSISILNQCKYFISNDTGLYHAASALKIPGKVYWKNTNLEKNKSPFNRISHVKL